jgi:hypothetical protein
MLNTRFIYPAHCCTKLDHLSTLNTILIFPNYNIAKSNSARLCNLLRNAWKSCTLCFKLRNGFTNLAHRLTSQLHGICFGWCHTIALIYSCGDLPSLQYRIHPNLSGSCRVLRRICSRKRSLYFIQTSYNFCKYVTRKWIIWIHKRVFLHQPHNLQHTFTFCIWFCFRVRRL